MSGSPKPRRGDWNAFWRAVRRRTPRPPTAAAIRAKRRHRLYTRPKRDEQFLIWRLASRGFGQRKIARCLGRDHHTVARHLERERGEDLALELAFKGRLQDAREMVQLLNGPESLAEQVEEYYGVYLQLRESVRTGRPFGPQTDTTDASPSPTQSEL